MPTLFPMAVAAMPSLLGLLRAPCSCLRLVSRDLRLLGSYQVPSTPLRLRALTRCRQSTRLANTGNDGQGPFTYCGGGPRCCRPRVVVSVSGAVAPLRGVAC